MGWDELGGDVVASMDHDACRNHHAPTNADVILESLSHLEFCEGQISVLCGGFRT
jgi:hypothetical protein